MTISSSDCAIRSGVAPDHVSLENFAKNPLSLVKSTCSPASSHRYFLQKNLKLLSNQPAVQLLGSKKFAKKKPFIALSSKICSLVPLSLFPISLSMLGLPSSLRPQPPCCTSPSSLRSQLLSLPMPIRCSPSKSN